MFFKENKVGNELDGWMLIFSSNNAPQSHLVCQLLIQNGIEAVIHNRQDSMYLSFGEIEVYVPKSDFETAKKVIGELKP